MKVIVVYSYTDHSESILGSGDPRLDINNTVIDIAGKRPTSHIWLSVVRM